MKFFKLFLFTAFISLAVSCSKDDSPAPENNSNNIIGVWKGTTVDYRGTTTTTAQGQTMTADYVGEAYDVDYTLTFTDNPKKVISDGSYSIELTTTVNGQSTTQNVPNLEFLSSGDWSINGSTLSITIDNETDEVTIEQLTDTAMVLKGVQTETNTGQGFTVVSNTEITLGFTKL